MLGLQADDHRGGIGKRDVLRDGEPVGQRRPLQAKEAQEAEDAPEKALNLQEQTIPASSSVGQRLGTQPIRTMLGIDLISFLGHGFLSLELGP